MGSDRPDEFETIARLLRPLAEHPAARGLTDDVAVLEPPPGKTLILTQDAMVEGVHFLETDPPDTLGRKLLRVNLSDLAAKGGEPFGYLMSCAWSDRCDWAWREAFARGLAEDQAAYGLTLLGGDSVVTPGPLTLGATLIGWGEPGRTPSRAGARAGDLLLVSGTIGDGYLGLQAAQGDISTFGELGANWLTQRYRQPNARVELASMVRRQATASADVSDGLVADAGNIAKASGLAVTVDLGALPLSGPARLWVERHANQTVALSQLATAGDDYEIVFTAPSERLEAIRDEAAQAGCPVTVVGRMETGEGVSVVLGEDTIVLSHLGWRHR